MMTAAQLANMILERYHADPHYSAIGSFRFSLMGHLTDFDYPDELPIVSGKRLSCILPYDQARVTKICFFEDGFSLRASPTANPGRWQWQPHKPDVVTLGLLRLAL